MTNTVKVLTKTQLNNTDYIATQDVLAATLFKCTQVADESAEYFEQASQLTIAKYHFEMVTAGVSFETIHGAMSATIIALFNSNSDKEVQITKLGAKYKDEAGKRKTYVPAGIVSLMSTIKSAVEKEISLVEVDEETSETTPRTKSQLQKAIAAAKPAKLAIDRAMDLVTRVDTQLVNIFEELTKDEQLQVLASLSTNCLKLQPLTDSNGAPSKPMFI